MSVVVRAWCAMALALVAASCKAAPLSDHLAQTVDAKPHGQAEVVSAPSPPSLPTVVDAALIYTLTDGVSTRRLETPMVAIRLGNVHTLMMVDTGAGEHMFTRALVDKVGLDVEPSHGGRDHTGELLATWQTRETGSLTIGFTPIDVGRLHVFEGPDHFEPWGIGGALTPQNLHPTATLVLDFVDQRLRLVDQPYEIIADNIRARHPRLVELRAERAPKQAGGYHSTILFSGALRADTPPIAIMLNTGGSDAEFTAAALGIAPGSPINGDGFVTLRGVTGRSVKAPSFSGRSVRFGSTWIPIDKLVVAPQRRCDGQLGSKALANTILVISADRKVPIRWWR